MTTQATTQIERRDVGGIGLQVAMTAVTLAALGALVLWQTRSGGETASPRAATVSTATATDGLPSTGRMAELYAEQQPAATPMRTALDGERVGAAERLTLIVASPDDIAEAYGALVECVQALDGSTPFAVTVVTGGAMAGEAQGR